MRCRFFVSASPLDALVVAKRNLAICTGVVAAKPEPVDAPLISFDRNLSIDGTHSTEALWAEVNAFNPQLVRVSLL